MECCRPRLLSPLILVSILLWGTSRAVGRDAICSSDNSYHVADATGRVCAVPTVVEDAVRHLESSAKKALAEFEDEGREPELTSELVRTVSPDGVQVYVLKIRGPCLYAFDHFIVCDGDGRRCAAAIPFVCGKWTAGFQEEPELAIGALLKFASLDGRSVFVVSEVVHNGTVYTGVVDHYYELGEGPTVSQVLAVESKVFDPRNSNRLLQRRLVIGKAGMSIETALKNLSNKQVTVLGNVALKRQSSGAYKVVRSGRAKPSHEYPLISIWCSSWDEADDFLCKGYTVYY